MPTNVCKSSVIKSGCPGLVVLALSLCMSIINPVKIVHFFIERLRVVQLKPNQLHALVVPAIFSEEKLLCLMDSTLEPTASVKVRSFNNFGCTYV